MAVDTEAMRLLRDRVAVVGVGETDYRADYADARRAEKQRRDEGGADPQRTAELDERPYAHAVRAFRSALADAGLTRDDIDGLAVANGSAYPLSFERVAEMLGLTLTWGAETGTPDHLVQAAVEGIASGRCTTVAIVYGNASRMRGLNAYGGGRWPRDGYMNQWYYHVWGFSSPGAQFALAYQQYLDRFGKDGSELATVPVAFRENALRNRNAVMRSPLTREQYLESPYLCRPFRLYDFCMVNDGGACLILRRADMSADTAHTPVLISGVGRHGGYARHTQMGFRLLDESWENIERASVQSRDMAGIDVGDVDLVQCYDGFSFQLPVFLEGFGFCAKGEGLDFVQQGRIGLSGELPCNTAGGMLSESYMHGMNLHVEAVRQLRHEAGPRQVPDARVAAYCHHGHWGALSMLYRRA